MHHGVVILEHVDFVDVLEGLHAYKPQTKLVRINAQEEYKKSTDSEEHILID